MRFSEYVFSFVCFAFVGWLLEVMFRSFRARTFVNPGFLSGPYLPIYGIGAVVLAFCATLRIYNGSFIIKGLAYFFLTTGLEFITGLIFEKYLHFPLWDYSDQRFKIKNYVCLQFSFYWLILAFVFDYLVLPPYSSCLSRLNPVALNISAAAMLVVMSSDFIVRCIAVTEGRKGESKSVPSNYESEFMDILRPLIENPRVQRLAYYTHHGNKTRFDHSMEVAWQSFVLSKKLSLDGYAAARGAMLHDLFFYDWLRAGPRLHGFRHPGICVKNARGVTDVSKKEEDIIRKHMWPLTVIPPRYKESWIVCFVDTFCSLKDYWKNTIHKLTILELRINK